MEASFVTDLRSSPPGASFSGFERFFREEYPAVVRIAFGVVGDAQAAQDVAQDVFISAFKRFPEPGDSDHARAWVRAAAAHTALNAIRGERRRERRQRSAAVEVPAAGPEETVLDAESRSEVRRALSRLPRKAAAVRPAAPAAKTSRGGFAFEMDGGHDDGQDAEFKRAG